MTGAAFGVGFIIGPAIGGIIGVPATAYLLAPVTKEVTFDVTAKRDGSDLTATATANPSWKFGDFGMTAPSVPFRVLSVTDETDRRQPGRDGKSHQQESFEDYSDHDLILYTTDVGMIHPRHIIRP